MKLTESERFNNSLIGKTSTAFLTGVGSVALGFATDIALGITLGYPPKPVGGLGQFALDGIATPAVVLSNLPLRYKLPIATAMFGLGRVSSYLRAKNE